MCFYKIYKNTVLVRDVLYALNSSRCESCASLKREGYICCFHGDIFAPKNGWFREKHKSRTIKFLFASSSTLCLLLSFPHYSKCFFVVLLVALQFYYPSEKEATSYTFLSRVAGQTTRRIARELHVQSTHHQSGTIDTRESSRKFRLNHHHGTFNALLSSSIGAFYVRFDPPTTAPSGALEKCAKNDDDDDAK